MTTNKDSQNHPVKSEDSLAFEGTIQKIRIISNNLCYGPAPAPDDEVEQRLSIRAGGGIWLTRYRYGGFDDRARLLGKEKIPADGETIQIILDAVAKAFSKNERSIYITDVGSWSMELTDSKGQTTNIRGALISGIPESFPGLSDFIRDKLHRNDLLLFDGGKR